MDLYTTGRKDKTHQQRLTVAATARAELGIWSPAVVADYLSFSPLIPHSSVLFFFFLFLREKRGTP